MGTISLETNCARCGYERADIEVLTGTDEYVFYCSRCGYMEGCPPLNDRKRKDDFLNRMRKDGELISRRHSSSGFGAYAIEDNEFLIWSKFDHQMSAEELQQFLEWLTSLIEPESKFYVTHWNEKTNSIDVVAGKFFGEGEGG